MIFVTVGNANDNSMRTLTAVEDLAARGFFGDEPVIIQSGNNPGFVAKAAKATPFMDMEEFARHVREARVVVCHAGAGTLSHVIATGKTPVVVPRRAKYREVIDDHQLELLEAFAERKLVVPAYEPEELPAAIQEASQRPPQSAEFGAHGRKLIADAIESLLGERK